MAEKSYRIRTNIGEDTVIKASLNQDIEFLEVLSLKIKQSDTYKLHVSNYGIIVGRVLANEAFGIPNAKISVFIKLQDEDLERSEITSLYPYKTLSTKDKESRRYNLLADTSNNDCHRIVGTFPNKRLVLDNETEIEIYEKYWKYTTVTNQSGDYMIFGVPTGSQTIHVDIDLSDIGILSQKPRDFFYKGYNQDQFDSAEQFKEGTNLENLTQLLSQDVAVQVLPFFGDKDMGEIAITRCDVTVPYKFEPTCVFFGSIISDKPGNNIGHACGPSRFVGYNSNLVTGEGTIEMIRKTVNGLVEEFPIKSNRLIDGDGVWCYQIPMNLDYIGTDEFGNIIPVQDSTKGIPTRTSVRFRISMQETKTQTSTEHVAKYLVPNIHELHAQTNHPTILNGAAYNSCYEFGSATPNEFFRDLLWNKVYSIKNYIPRFEHRSGWEKFIGRTERSYMGIRTVNNQHNNNVFPFNSARFRLKFTYRLLCLLMTIVVTIISFYNKLVSEVICWELSFKVVKWRVGLGKPLKFLSKWIKCIGLKGGMFFEERADTYYFPMCDKDCGSIIKSEGLKVNKSSDDLIDIIQQTLALEYDLVHLDFTNDWVNGTLYLPLWFWKKRAKKKYFFGLFSKKAVNTFCSCDKTYEKLRLAQSCAVTYNGKFQPQEIGKKDDKKLHKNYNTRELKFGVIKEVTNNAGLHIYYYAPGVPQDMGYLSNEGLTKYTQLFATDIILLGSLNSCDLDNLPKTFDSLPSSTVNLPFIATFESDESGDGVVTGLDWGHNGESTPIKYQNGLLMDLTCWDVYTRFKSCVNLSRLSELHVTLDMDMTIDDKSEKNIVHDGLITTDELVDNETRAKFASLNHNGMSILTKNVTTNYDTYKFHYIYPVDFDGHLSVMEQLYTKNSDKFYNDGYDSNYAMYRLGEGKDSKLYGRHKKHFYNGSENNFSFPLYNNSFYFYFGLNEGKTAIDKFNSLFNATCAKRNKYDFTVEYVTKPSKWCYDVENTATDFGTIDIEFNGLTDTFSYTLYNEFNEELISEVDVKSQDLRFGYDIVSDGGSYIMTSKGYKRDGRLKEFNTGKLVTNSLGLPIYLTNGVYYLEVINSLGKKVTQKINMIQNTLSPNIESINLGTKFKHGVQTSVDICGRMDYYGELIIKSFIIDGEEAFIKEMTPYFKDSLKYYYELENGDIVLSNDGYVEYNGVKYDENISNAIPSITIGTETYVGKTYQEPKEVTCKVLCTDGSEIYLILEPENDETQDISNFVCYGVGDIPSVELKKLGDDIFSLIFNIWKPGDYVLTSTQICDGVMNDNVSVNKISIENGEYFQAFLNGIPLQLIHNDNFKNTNRYSGDTFPRAWLQLENPKLYTFGGTKYQDIEFWETFMDITEGTTQDGNTLVITSDSKIQILKTQIETIAKMRNMGYVMHEENLPQITMTTKGGKEPILIRNIHPNYAEITDENEKVNSIIVENNPTLEGPLNYPHIVDKLYQKARWWNHQDENIRIRKNDTIYGPLAENIGNYFAAFTNNGGIIELQNNENYYDASLYVESSPSNAMPLTTLSTVTPIKLNYYPQTILNKETAYFRSMFVDKRLLFYGTLWAPIFCDYNIYGNNDSSWKRGKWNLNFYHVAPMPYDDEYNIIGDELSYDFMVQDDSIPYSSATISWGSDDKYHFRFKAHKFSTQEDPDSWFVIDTNFGVFKRDLNVTYGDNNVIISGKTIEDLEYVMNYYFYDDKFFDIHFTSGGTNDAFNTHGCSRILYKTLRKPTMEDFQNDTNIKLVSHLDWFTDDHPYVTHGKRFMRNNSRLYKSLLSIDGVESDIRDEFDFNIQGSECNADGVKKEFIGMSATNTLYLLNQGSQLTLESANCKLTGDLEYEVDEEENKYIFKSHVESAGDVKTSFDIGSRLNILSFETSYGLEKNGEYIIWNNERIYLTNNENEYVAHPCVTSGDDTYIVTIVSAETQENGIVYYNTNKLVMKREKNDEFYYPCEKYTIKDKYNRVYELNRITDSNFKGYIMSIHMVLSESELTLLQNLCSKQYGSKALTNSDEYYYKDNLIQDFLNRYGRPAYVNKFDNGGYKMLFGFSLNNVVFLQDCGSVCSFGSYVYEENGKYYVKKEYRVLKGKINGELVYIFYNEREGQKNANYESNVMFYEPKKIKVNKIIIPTLIYFDNNNKKYYEKIVQTYEYWIKGAKKENYKDNNSSNAIHITFMLGETTIPNVSLSNVKDGDKIKINSIDYTFEFNDLTKRWYLYNTTTNEYKSLSYIGEIYEKGTDKKIDSKFYGEFIQETTNNIKAEFSNITENSLVISYLKEITINELTDDKFLRASYESMIQSTPQIVTSEEEGKSYVWLSKEIEYTRDNSTQTINFNGETYKIYKDLYNVFRPKHVDDFSCKIVRDVYNDNHDQIETPAPILSCSIRKKYAFPKTTKDENALDGSGLQLSSWVSSNKAIINKHPRNYLNGNFLTTHSLAVANNKIYNTARLVPRNDGSIYVVKRNGSRIKFPIRKSDAENGDYEVKIWDIILLRYMYLGNTEYPYGGKKGDAAIKLVSGSDTTTSTDADLSGKTNLAAVKIIMDKLIDWVSISHSEYERIFKLTSYYEGSTKVDIDVAPHRSIMDKGTFECWDIKLQKMGDKYYFQGEMNYENTLKDNIDNSTRYYSNCNRSFVAPYLKSDSDNLQTVWGGGWLNADKTYLETFFNRSPVIGEIYPYIDLNYYGSKDGNGLFALTNDYAEQETFGGVNSVGMQYGKYEPLFFRYNATNNYVWFFNIKGDKVKSSAAYGAGCSERAGVNLYESILIPSYNDLSNTQRIHESDDVYDSVIYVLQHGLDTQILENTIMLTCTICKTYYDSNLDYNFHNTTTFNQSANIHVGPIYVGNPMKKDDKMLIPFYMINDMNEEVMKGFDDQNIKYHFNGEEYYYKESNDEYNEVFLSYKGKIYFSTDETSYAISTSSYNLSNIINSDKYASSQIGINKYFINYSNLKLYDKDGINGYAGKKYNILQLRRIKETPSVENLRIKISLQIFNPIHSDNMYDDVKFTALSDRIFYADGFTYNRMTDGGEIEFKLTDKIQDIKQYYYSTKNGENCVISGETFEVNLLPTEYNGDFIETINYNNTEYDIFSNIWTIGTYRHLIPFDENVMEGLQNKYDSNVTCEEYFTYMMEQVGFLKEGDTLQDAFSKAFDSNSKFTISSKFKNRLYKMVGGTYYTKENGSSYYVEDKDGKIYEEKKDGYGYYIEESGNQKNYAYEHMFIKKMEIIEKDANYEDFQIELIDPYNSTDILQKYTFKGLESYSKYLSYEGNVNSSETYSFNRGHQNSDLILEQFNNHLRNLNINEYITIIDKRISNYYPFVYKSANSSNKLFKCGSNMKNKNGESCVIELPLSASLKMYNKNDIFNTIINGSAINNQTLTTGTTKDNTIYPLESDVIFGEYCICEIETENITQIICEDGYSIIGNDSEPLTTIKSNGEKEIFLFNDIKNRGMLGLNLYHLSEVDGVYYEFVSKISQVKNINRPKILYVNANNLTKIGKYVLSLEINNLIYKLLFTYDGENLKPNF